MVGSLALSKLGSQQEIASKGGSQEEGIYIIEFADYRVMQLSVQELRSEVNSELEAW